jgi:hypothetical protein
MAAMSQFMLTGAHNLSKERTPDKPLTDHRQGSQPPSFLHLAESNKTKMFSYNLPPNLVKDAKNATGDGYDSDGRLLVIFLQ